MSNVVPLRPVTSQQLGLDRPEEFSVPGRAVYTVAEVAELLSLSLASAYTLIRAGEIPARKLGGRWVIPKKRFDTWLNDLPDATDEEHD